MNNIDEVVQLLKYIKIFEGKYQGFAHHTNSHDIDTLTLLAIISTFIKLIIYSIVQMFNYKLLNLIQGQTLKTILILII